MNTQNSPRISVILPVYNTAKYLPECIESILNQTFADFELVIVDDKSTDGSYEIVQKYTEKDSRIKLFQNQKNSGVSHTTNQAISKTTAKYIAVMNSDDSMFPTRLEKQYKFLENNPDHIAVGSQVRLIDTDSNELGLKSFPVTHETIYSSIYLNNPVQHSSMTINRENLPQDFTWYNEEMRLSEDLDMLFRLLQYGKLHNHEDELLYYRIHPTSLSQKSPKEMYWLGYQARTRAKKLYGYKPSLKNELILHTSMVLIMLLPSSIIFPLFYKIRKLLLKIA